jgi:hypothetical protein
MINLMKLFPFLLLLLISPVGAKEKNRLQIKREGIVVGGLRFPQVTFYADKRAMNKYNSDIKSLANSLRCSSKKINHEGAFYSVESSLSFTKNSVLSLKVRADYNCNGLHHFSDIDKSFTYDLLNNRKLYLSDLISRKEKSLLYIRSEFSKGLGQACLNKISFYLDDPTLFRKWIQFYLSKDSIHLRLNVPYSIKECAQDISIPFATAKDLVTVSTLFKRITR